jgi:SAM-dependent methyltransferase
VSPIKSVRSVISRSSNKFLKKLVVVLPASARNALLRLLKREPSLYRYALSMVYHQDPEAAISACRLFNDGSPDVDDNCDKELIRRAIDFGYLGWARRIQPYVQGKSILDVGCGTGLHGIGYVVAGAKSYTGLDPKIDLDSDLGKNKNTAQYEHFGTTPREIMKRMPRIHLVPGQFEDIAPHDTFDLVVLHNVTEHLLNIEAVFQGISRRLDREGRLIFQHHNFYCWDGHHLSPRTIDQIDTNDPAQRDVLDWSHLTFVPPEGHYISRGLNKIRLDELKALTAQYFDIEVWEESKSTMRQGLGRLTPEIRSRYAQYSERELMTKNVFCVAHHKGARLKPVSRSQFGGVTKKIPSRERDMRRDEVFMSFFDRCKPYTMTSIERLYGLYQAVAYLQRHEIEGDIVECGVWRGGSMMMVALSLMHFRGIERDLYLFDTFAGMPEPTDEDYKIGESTAAHEKWEQLKSEDGSQWNYASVDEVRASMLSTGYMPERLHLVQGMVEDTLPQQAPERIALLRLDTDFYASTVHEFQHLYPRLAGQGVLIIDDFGTWAGSAQATQEYFEGNNIVMLLNRLDPGGRIGVKSEPAVWQ